MLFTASISEIDKIPDKMKVYFLLKDKENSEVMPDDTDINFYKKNIITWDGLFLNYSAKLMRSDAMEWMERVTHEAISEDVILVDESDDVEHSYRKILAERMKNLSVGHLNLKYIGEFVGKD